MKRIAVIGGGISGLTAAYELGRRAPEVDVVVHEASDRLGGKLLTTPFAGRLVDEGADAFLARVPWGLDLCAELGLDTELVSPATGAAFVYVDGALRPLPSGLVLGVPTDLDALAKSGIVSSPVVVRPAEAPLAADDDPSVGALVRAQLGDAVCDRLVDPLLGGINAGNADRLSLRAAAPQLAAAAERDADLVRALQSLPPAAAGARAGEGPVFYTPVGGMGALIDALAAAVRAEIRLGSRISDVDEIEADAVIVAVPAPVATRLVPELRLDVEYASVTLVTLAFPAQAVGRELDGSGFLVPRTERLLMTAASWATSKWAHLAGEDGLVVLRVSAGRIDDERASGLDDNAVVARLVEELSMTMAVTGEPVEVRVSRWPRSFPQYAPGHLARVAAAEGALAESRPNVVVTGAALRGLGVPACIRQGREAAARALATLNLGPMWMP